MTRTNRKLSFEAWHEEQPDESKVTDSYSSIHAWLTGIADQPDAKQAVVALIFLPPTAVLC